MRTRDTQATDEIDIGRLSARFASIRSRVYPQTLYVSSNFHSPTVIRARQAPDASRVAEMSGKPKLALGMHFLTSKQKTHPNQRFQSCADSMDTQSFDQFSRFLNSDTAMSVSKRTIGISTHASTLSHREQELNPFVTKGIHGDRHVHQEYGEDSGFPQDNRLFQR